MGALLVLFIVVVVVAAVDVAALRWGVDSRDAAGDSAPTYRPGIA